MINLTSRASAINKFLRKLPALTLICIGFLMPGAGTVDAQTPETIEVVSTATYVYGNRLEFNISGTPPETIIDAALTIFVSGLEEFTESVPVSSINTELSVRHTIEVEALNLPPAATVTYYWHFVGGSGTQYRSRLEALQYSDNSAPWMWDTVQQDHLIIWHSPEQQAVAEEALIAGTNTIRQVSQLLGVSLQENVTIIIYPELASLTSSLRLHNLRVQDWVAAYAIPTQRVALIALDGSPDSSDSYLNDLSHELTHLLVAIAAGEQANNVPGWLNEGLALYSMPAQDEALNQVLSNSLREEQLIPLETLCASTFTTLPHHSAALAYAQSGAMIQFIIERYGSESIRQLITAYISGNTCENGVRQALGISLQTLDNEWESSLRRGVTDITEPDISLTPWLIVMLISIALALLFIAPQTRRWVQPDTTELKILDTQRDTSL